jgi:OHCU decarboxylase
VSDGLDAVDAAERADVVSDLVTCCGARAWAEQMADARPFGDLETMLTQADRIWWSLAADDWLQAFACHPRIGDKRPKPKQTERESSWSAQEQAGTQAAAPTTLEALNAVNRDYEARFGHVYLVCATGKSAEQMLSLARDRLGNEPAAELRVAAEQQRQITHIRLQKLLESR